MIKKIIYLIIIIGLVLVAIGFYNDQKQDELLNSIDQVEIGDNQDEGMVGESMDKSGNFDSYKVKVRGGEITESSDKFSDIEYGLTFTGFAVGKSHVTEFEDADIEIYLDESLENISGEITFQADSITSPDGDKLVEHLKSDDFLGVESNPTISFTSKGHSTPVGESTSIVQVEGNLSFLGQTKSIQFPMSVERDNATITLTVDASLDLKEFGFNPEPLAKSEVRMEGMFSATLR